VLKVMERDTDDAPAAGITGSPRCLQSVYDVMSQSMPTSFVFNSHTNPVTDVR